MNNINQESYNEISSIWDNYRKSRPINKCIIDFAQLLKENGRVLDIGCGSGYPIDQYLDNLGFHVLGIDISSKMIEKANTLRLKNSSFLVCDFMDFDSDNKYDAIIAFDSLWHISDCFQEQMYIKIAELLNINGYLLFTAGINKEAISGTMFNKQFFYYSIDKNDLKQLLTSNGFSIISWFENYQEESTETRDLLVIAKKTRREK